jgi:hypothetical protein
VFGAQFDVAKTSAIHRHNDADQLYFEFRIHVLAAPNAGAAIEG